MATFEALFGAASNFTLTLASLADSATAARQSTAVDNSSDLFLDALVLLKVKSGASAAGDEAVYVYAFASVDDGTTYTEGAGASDAAITLTNPSNARLIGVIATPASGTTYIGGPFSVAAAFGGVLPKKWGIIVRNKSGAALDSTEGSHAKQWQGVKAQSV